MKSKKLAFLMLGSLASAVAIAMIVGTNRSLFAKDEVFKLSAVDSWTEKAYVAPTTSENGYKHYYLGCPGNYRTSDSDHLNEVSLEDITVSALTSIERAAVDGGDNILLVNEAKIKYLDQSTSMGVDGGTAVFVRDNGHDALFSQEVTI